MQKNRYCSRLVIGFTILELIITVAIVAILATTASSLYTSYVQRSNREMAKIQLQQDASKMEQYYSQNGSYFNITNNSWPSTSIESYVSGTSGTVYTVSFVPSQPTLANKEAFNIIASPVSNSIQSSDSSGNLCINQTGTIVENVNTSCTTGSSGPNPSLCSGGLVTSPAIANCANQDCSGKTICGNCSAGNGGGVYNYGAGSCANTYIGGACFGLCSNSTIKGACMGDCTNSVVCGTCSGTCTGVTQTGC